MHSPAFADVPFFLAMAEHGSLPAAARALGVNHSTVLRRIRAFEKRLGVTLFERRSTGHVPSPAAEALLGTARQMREMLVDAERRIAGEDLRLEGVVRMTTTDTLAQSVLPRVLAGFSAEHPGVRVDLTTVNAILSLSRRDAEVAVRPSKEMLASYVGRRVSEIAFAIYAAPAYCERIPPRTDLDRHRWVGLDESLERTTIARWMARELGDARVVLRVDSLTALAHAAAGGIGVAALPCYLGDSLRALRRIRGLVPSLATELWILTHADSKRTARIRALTEWLAEGLGRERDLLLGRRVVRA